MFKDSNGLMWIATETGLCTFDGKNFKIFSEADGLKYNLIWKIIEDNKKNIWLSTYGYGVAKYDGEKFTYYDKKINGLVNDNVRSIYFFKEYDCILFGTEDGLSIFDGKKFINFKLKSKDPSGFLQINAISKYFNSIILSSGMDDLYELYIDKNDIEKSKIVKKYNSLNQNYSGFIEEENYYCVNQLHQFEIYNLKSGNKKAFGQCPALWDFVKDNQNNIYAAGWDVNTPTGGLLRYKNNKLTDLSRDLKLPTSLFWCLYFDKNSSQLWAGSIDEGIFVIDLTRNISLDKNEFSELLKPEINSICIDHEQNIWLGGNNFISKKSGNQNLILTTLELKCKVADFIRYKNDAYSIELQETLKTVENFVCHNVKQDSNKDIWAMTSYGLINFDKNFNLKKMQFFANTGGVFDFVDENQLIISQSYRLSYLLQKRDLEKYTKTLYKDKPISLTANKMFKATNRIWIATSYKGLILYENSKILLMEDLGYLKDKNISEVIEDDQKNIITGTFSGKLYFSKWQNQKLSHHKILYPDKDIIGNSVSFVRQYGDYYFIGTNKGINIIKDFKLFKFINKAEHLLEVQYKDASIDWNSKKLLIATYKGLISLDIVSVLKEEKVNSPLKFTQIKVNNQIQTSITNTNLAYNQNNIELTFSSNNTYNASKNQYRYKIKGLHNNEWSTFSAENSLKLFGLESGTYEVSIDGKNIGTNENFTPIKLTFIIDAPFYKTSWFIILIAIILIIIGLIYTNRKVKRIKKTALLEKRIAQTRLQALQGQMKPHFVFNAMNSIQNFVIDNKTDDALWYIGEFSKLIRQTLNFSSKKTIKLQHEIDYLKRYIALENLRRKHKVNFEIIIDAIIDCNKTKIAPLLIEPLIENVFVHAFDSTELNPEMKIKFSLADNNLICQIKDNGQGFNPLKPESKGLNIVNERLKILSSDNKSRLTVEKLEKGTLAIIEIPLR
jgi:sensor histidine kinase YesM